MIPYVDTELAIWGKWVVAKASKGIGYSPICPMFKDARHSGCYGSNPPVGAAIGSMDNVLDTDAAVQRLGVDQRKLCVEYYVVGGKAVEVAGRLGIARQRLYERVHALHQSMLGHLNDVAAGC